MILKQCLGKNGEWHECYVIFPVQSICGEWIFFNKAQKRWNKEKFIALDFIGHSYSYGGWDYRINKND